MRLRTAFSSVIIGALVAGGLAVGAPTVVQAAPGLPACPAGYRATDVQCNQYSNPGPLGGISVIGDSVLLGSSDNFSNPGLPNMLAGAGWGPVNFLAGKGYTTGRNLGAGRPTTAAYWINRWRAEGWDPSVVLVNLGNNDNAFCPANVACMKQTIDYLLNVIGAQVEVWWPLLTTVDYTRAAAWNSALRLAEQERPNLHVWDWPTALATANPPIVMDGYAIHPASGPQYVRRSRMMTDDVTTVFGPSRRVGPNATPPAAAGGPSDYLPVPVSRITTGLHIDPGSTATLDLSSLAPADATAVALTLESRNPVGPGYLTTYPCGGTRPMTSNLNFVAGQRRGAQALATLTAAKTVCIFSYDATDVDIDVQGWFVASAASRFDPTVPTRLLDTRETGRNPVDVITVPAGATAVALSLVGLDAAQAGSLTVWSCDQPRPDLAQIYFGPGEIIAGAAYVLASAQGTVCVGTSTAADIVVDMTGTFSAAGRLRYTPSVVQRMVDTREGLGGWSGRVDPGQSIDLQPAPAGAEAVSGTLTMVQPTISGWLRATPCGQSQLSSSVNAPAGAILANSLTVGLSADQRLCIETYRGAHVLFDVSGWWAP
ncbi:MAG: hypothetical protein JWM12_800 [Ilumatobacteraceae bacterium]|jgi:hypothetical protein|nr:hypothetical protein [Ilumatobacteraceae bacterium]